MKNKMDGCDWPVLRSQHSEVEKQTKDSKKIKKKAKWDFDTWRRNSPKPRERKRREIGCSNVSHARSREIGCPQSKKLPNGSGTRVQVHRTHPKTATGGTLSDASSVFFFFL